MPHWAPNGKGSQPPPPPPTDRGGPGVLPRPHGPGSQGCHPRSLGRAEAQGCYLLGELHGHAEPTPRTQGLGPACPPARNSCRQGPLPTPCPGQERPHGRGAGPVGSGPGGRAPRVAQPRLGNSDFTLVLTPEFSSRPSGSPAPAGAPSGSLGGDSAPRAQWATWNSRPQPAVHEGPQTPGPLRNLPQTIADSEEVGLVSSVLTSFGHLFPKTSESKTHCFLCHCSCISVPRWEGDVCNFKTPQSTKLL